MQYKIPVQIENEDPVFLWLSLRQLWIIMVWFWIAYALFKNTAEKVWPEIAAIPSIIIAVVAILIATFKQYEMTFIPFILSAIRFNINAKERKWVNWTDSYQPIDIWYLSYYDGKKQDNVDFKSKIDKISEIENKIDKL
jgi:hypothetical protein